MQRRAFENQFAQVGNYNDNDTDPDDPLSGAGWAGLQRVSFPVLVTCGELELPDFRQGAQRIAQHLGGPPARILAGVGHLLPMERPALFRALIAEFLDDPSVTSNW